MSTFATVSMSFGAFASRIAFVRCEASSEVAAEERRRRRDERAVHHGEVQRDVMPFDAPAPRVPRRRRAEDREEVPHRVADERRTSGLGLDRAPGGLERAQHRFEIHDRRRGQISALAQPGLEQVVRELPLRLIHRLNEQAFARKRLGRDEVPVQPFVRVERERRLLALVGRQRVHESGRGGRHRGRGAFGGDHRADCQGGDERRRQAQTG